MDSYWFNKKWGTSLSTPMEILFKKIEDLENRVKTLEEENVSTTNELYRMENSLDARIDILAEHIRIDYNV
jgi:chaperonin cofactor prefoldin